VFRNKFLETPKNIIGVLLSVIFLGTLIVQIAKNSGSNEKVEDPLFGYANPELVMRDGDPYIRALMRTISASEANDRQPYSLIYGGSRAKSLDRHPRICIRIRGGPNRNNCSTAAGRYQMIDSTWFAMAKRYGASQRGWFWDRHYSFAPIEQDKVVHSWLSDRSFWNMDIAQQLRNCQLTKVRKRLSSTWTSLGYGIENNAMTPALTKIYSKILPEELAQARQQPQICPATPAGTNFPNGNR
jgi:muramidase (phage lysozyme)